MDFLDIVLGALLIYALYKGLKNGLFAELASFLSLIMGIYLAIKFSHLIREIVSSFFSWSPKLVQIIAFGLTFIAVVLGIHFLAKVFDRIMNMAYLGWTNKLAGGFFSLLKTVLLLSVVFNLFQKINFHNFLVKEETLNNSTFYNPIQKVSKLIYPSLENLYTDLKKKKE
jgi:membrane protein required for colicin V production